MVYIIHSFCEAAVIGHLPYSGHALSHRHRLDIPPDVSFLVFVK